mmetsp:Transcript_869/g.1808  ORF Transcript_869/g.1808 Transcript_869/m.1808 type:complete len:186 (+) Transcript_869:2-559(+)
MWILPATALIVMFIRYFRHAILFFKMCTVEEHARLSVFVQVTETDQPSTSDARSRALPGPVHPQEMRLGVSLDGDEELEHVGHTASQAKAFEMTRHLGRIYASERWLYLMHAWQGTVLDILVGGMLSGTAFAIAVVEASVSPGKAGVLLTTTLIASAYLSSCPQALSNVIKRAERVGSVLRKQTN